MNDRLPGTTYDNPIRYRGKWRIFLHDNIGPHAYDFVHDDFDGAPDANDNRCGHANSVEECKRDIDALYEENEWPCDHEYRRVGTVGMCIVYQCVHCPDEYEKDVS